jgi:4-aminobutyrate aminotransferase
MISESELAKLSYPEAPKIVTAEVPGPKTQKLLEESSRYQLSASGAGNFPCVYDEVL